MRRGPQGMFGEQLFSCLNFFFTVENILPLRQLLRSNAENYSTGGGAGVQLPQEACEWGSG